jgi:5-(aminomethyl)-3-furanmethanol phosphate kinase
VTASSLTVIKVGGSLFEWPEFPQRMAGFLTTLKAVDQDGRIVLIAGGGPAADIVRALDRAHALGDLTSHRLALFAMDLTAVILSELLPGTVAVQGLEAITAVWSTGANPVLAPRLTLEHMECSGDDDLRASWDVTSDTIAAWMARRIAADRLILVKSAPLPAGTDRQDAARLGLVDPEFPIVARPLPRVEYLNLREPASPPRLLP